MGVPFLWVFSFFFQRKPLKHQKPNMVLRLLSKNNLKVFYKERSLIVENSLPGHSAAGQDLKEQYRIYWLVKTLRHKSPPDDGITFSESSCKPHSQCNTQCLLTVYLLLVCFHYYKEASEAGSHYKEIYSVHSTRGSGATKWCDGHGKGYSCGSVIACLPSMQEAFAQLTMHGVLSEIPSLSSRFFKKKQSLRDTHYDAGTVPGNGLHVKEMPREKSTRERKDSIS